jgi:hypothetical protein
MGLDIEIAMWGSGIHGSPFRQQQSSLLGEITLGLSKHYASPVLEDHPGSKRTVDPPSPELDRKIFSHPMKR